ncbi:MAG TPA: hypothetical protein VII06_43200 [Chloroflexota bacterium]
MARFTVIVPEPIGDAVIDLADRDFRRPNDQAAYLITEALRARGVLPAVLPGPSMRAGNGGDAA